MTSTLTREDRAAAPGRAVPLTRAQRWIVAGVAIGAAGIAGIGFAGSYRAVSAVAAREGFGTFSHTFPFGVDLGIAVLYGLDLLLTWLRIPFPPLRMVAWFLTVGTITFNAAAAHDPLGVAMHATLPSLFVVIVEAGRHAIGRLAAITADRHIESIRLLRWVLSPYPTFRLWRQMYLFEIRQYDEAIRREIDRLVYRTRMRAEHGRRWRSNAPAEQVLPVRLSRFGVPVPTGGVLPAPALPPGGSADLDEHVAVALELVKVAARQPLPRDGEREAGAEREPPAVNGANANREAKREADGEAEREAGAEREPPAVNGANANREAKREADGEAEREASADGEPPAVNRADTDREAEREAPAVKRRRAPRAARQPRPVAVHAVVRPPTQFQLERASAAAKWFAAKAADPGLTQGEFAASLGRSDGWLSKVIGEANKAKAKQGRRSDGRAAGR